MTSTATRPPQVPTKTPWLGHGLRFGRDPVGFIEACRKRYGDVFTLKLLGVRRTLLLDPRDYPAYFKDKRLQFAIVGTEMGERVFGYDTTVAGLDVETLTHASGRLLQGKHLPPLGQRFQQLLAARLATHDPTSGPDRLLRWIHEHAFAAATEAMCGDGFYSPAVYRAYATVDRYFPLLLAGVPIRLLPGCLRARRRFASEVGRKRPGRAHVMEVRDVELVRAGAPPGDVDLYNAAWVWASQVNTLNATFWTLLLVLHDPEARRAIEHEIREVCGSTPLQGSTFDEAQLRALVRLDSAITEALRLSSGPMATRRAMEPLELSTASGQVFRFDRGENIDLFPYLNHVDPEIYEHPFTFRYDRFLADPKPPQFFKNGEKLAFPLLVFGSGVSMCPGRFLARSEVKIAVALLLCHFELEFLTQEVPALDFSRMGLGVLPPVRDVSFEMRRR